jgi:hypothetical protein
MSKWALKFWYLNFRLRICTISQISRVRNIEFWHPCVTFFPLPLLHQPVCQSVCLSSLMSRVITSTLNQTVTYWLQGGMSCHCSLAKCCAGSSLNVAQERLDVCDGHQNFVSFVQLLFLSRFAYSWIFFIPKGNGRWNFLFYMLLQNYDKRSLATSCLPVRPFARNNSTPTGWIFMKFGIWTFFDKFSENSIFVKIRKE